MMTATSRLSSVVTHHGKAGRFTAALRPGAQERAFDPSSHAVCRQLQPVYLYVVGDLRSGRLASGEHSKIICYTALKRLNSITGSPGAHMRFIRHPRHRNGPLLRPGADAGSCTENPPRANENGLSEGEGSSPEQREPPRLRAHRVSTVCVGDGRPLLRPRVRVGLQPVHDGR